MNENNYGFVFNNIIIADNVFKKSPKNKVGQIKIKNESEFYFYIKNGSVVMQFLPKEIFE